MLWLDGKLHTPWYAILCINLYVGHQKHSGSFMCDKCDKPCNMLLQDVHCSASKPYSFFQKSKRQDRSFSNIKSRIIQEKIWSIVVKRKGDFLWLLDGGQIACKRVHTYFTWPTQSELGQAANMTGGQLSIEKPTFSLLIYSVTFD